MSLVETFIKYDLIKLDTLKYIYTTAIPLKHIYIDSFLSKSDLDSILSEWPSLQDTHWHTLN